MEVTKAISFLKPIENFDGYFISDNGTVWCNLGKGNRRLGNHLSFEDMYKLNPRYTKNGYTRVYMRNSETGKRVDKYIHRLVAEAFIDNPEDKKYVNHKNCVRDCNCIENLEWVTAKENTDQTAVLNHIVRDNSGKYVSNFTYPF